MKAERYVKTLKILGLPRKHSLIIMNSIIVRLKQQIRYRLENCHTSKQNNKNKHKMN